MRSATLVIGKVCLRGVVFMIDRSRAMHVRGTAASLFFRVYPHPLVEYGESLLREEPARFFVE